MERLGVLLLEGSRGIRRLDRVKKGIDKKRKRVRGEKLPAELTAGPSIESKIKRKDSQSYVRAHYSSQKAMQGFMRRNKPD